MIIHCTECDHEWQAVHTKPCCFSCGFTVYALEDHEPGCPMATCDWCGAPGKVIDTRTPDLPSIEEVMEDLADMVKRRKEDEEVNLEDVVRSNLGRIVDDESV